MLTADVVIPVYRPGASFLRLLERLETQSYPIGKIIIMNTEERFFPRALTARYEKLEVRHLTKAQFDHGGTRDIGIRSSSADVTVCMTQDAEPADAYLIERLMEPFSDPAVWVSYARQLPRADCGETERYARSFNYPDESRVKGRADLKEMGIKAFFCSNVCAAWRRSAYVELGGFEKRTIFNEDMILAGRMIGAGGRIAYRADARVIHSHNYSAAEQFRRYFDLAVSQAMHPELFAGVSSQSEGMRLVKKSVRHCVRIGKPWLIFNVVSQNAGKFLGYRLGLHYRRLPKWVIHMCTMNRAFWENVPKAGR